MSVKKILQRLDKVKKTGAFKWQACCPAHDDHGPSLAIRELGDGRVLIHCFAGCGAGEVLEVLNLQFVDLYPNTDASYLPSLRKPWVASDVLHALQFEMVLAWNFSKQMADGRALNESEQARLMLCASRLGRGVEVVNG